LKEWIEKLNELCKHTLGITQSTSFVLKQGNYRPLHIKKVEEVYQQPVNLSKGKTFDSICGYSTKY